MRNSRKVDGSIIFIAVLSLLPRTGISAEKRASTITPISRTGTSIAVGDKVTLEGTISPWGLTHSGMVRIETKIGESWVLLAGITIDAAGHYLYVWQPKRVRGRIQFVGCQKTSSHENRDGRRCLCSLAMGNSYQPC